MESRLARRVQTSAPGSLVELYDLDLTPIDPTAPIIYFISSANESVGAGFVTWRGNQYFPQPMKIDGIDTTTKGSLPRPTLSVSNIFGAVTGIIQQYGRVSGAILTRWQTFDVYLDNGADPNPDGHLPIDQFILDRIVSHNKLEVQIECRSFLDFGVQNLPNRLVLQNICTHTYRIFNSSTGLFDYTNATCPYNGGPSFDTNGNPTSAPFDDCSRQLTSGCRKRFGTQPLPIRAFPGVGRLGS